MLLVSSLSSYAARPEGQASPFASAAVVSVDPIASNIGLDILKKGDYKRRGIEHPFFGG